MPARDDDKAMDGLLRRSLARDAANAGECPDADILAAYYERSLDADEAAGYEQHFAQCMLCREHLAALVRTESALEVPGDQPLAVAAALAPRAKAAGPSSVSAGEKPKHSWVFGWRWLAPVAAVIIFAVFVYIRIAPRETKTFPSKNEVAVSKPEAVPLPTPSQDLSAPAARSKASREALAKPPAAAKPKVAPPPAQATAPPPVPQPSVHAPNAQPRAGTTSGAKKSPSTTAGFVTGAMARSRGIASGVAAQKQPAADAAASAHEGENYSEQPAAAPPARSAVHPAAAPTTPPPAEAKKEVTPSDSSAQASRVYAASKKPETSATADGSTGGAINSNAESLQVTGSTASVAIMAKIGPLYRITSDGTVERSSDGGATWQLERLKTNSPIMALSAPLGKICWLVGRGGTILLTRNGKSWKKISPPLEIDLVGVTARDEHSATVTAIDGRQFSTEDTGKNWQESK
jgi:photosynthesis system II assembly factor YCF48-like protein